jgi:CRISPR-associated protein Cas5d
MSFGVTLRVWGEYALFTRPEMKVERVSYDVITPSAARGIIEAIHWKPSIRWVVDRIHVLKPIRFFSIRRNELSSRASINKNKIRDNQTICRYIDDDRRQRGSLILKDVEYVIEAHFEFTSSEDNNEGKHLDMFKRRAVNGQCFYHPYLGCREFPASFEWCENIPRSPLAGEQDLGFMLHDIDFDHGMTPKFFRAVMRDGVIDCSHEVVS